MRAAGSVSWRPAPARVLACQHATRDGCELRLLRPSARVIHVWKILGLDAVLPIYHSLDEAMAGAG